MCHRWWEWQLAQEREASRRMWDEFERTRPLSDREVPEQPAPDVTLAQPEQERLAPRPPPPSRMTLKPRAWPSSGAPG